MQDFSKYDYTLTIEKLKKIMEEYQETIIVIINGEYYELK